MDISILQDAETLRGITRAMDLILGPGGLQHTEQASNATAWTADQDICHEPGEARLLAVSLSLRTRSSCCWLNVDESISRE